MQAQAAGLWPSPPPIPYIEDVFQTWLYTGNGATQTITNGINLSGKGGLVWFKPRTPDGYSNRLYDTVRGVNKGLNSGFTGGQFTTTDVLNVFNSTGFTLGSDPNGTGVNSSGISNVSWTFRKQPKFFDVVTYTGDGVNNRAISHSLTSAPGCIIVKRTSSSNDWRVYHRSMGSPAQNYFMSLNTTQAAFDTSVATMWPSAPTSTDFYVSDQSEVNASGSTYVAYLFAHNAGGFGATETDNVISCGSYTGNGSATGPVINLGYEPQWLLVKNASGAGDWRLYDSMRGLVVQPDSAGGGKLLIPNSSAAEADDQRFSPTATGFNVVSSGASVNANGSTYIYIAIRRGPMKTPTDATKVYKSIARTGTNANATISGVGFSPDLTLGMERGGSNQNAFVDRLRGISPTAFLQSINTSAEVSLSTATNLGVTSLTMDGVTVDADQTFGYINFDVRNYSTHFFKRAPGFFDEVCYSGTGAVGNAISHNLGVAPELAIFKGRGGLVGSGNWSVFTQFASTNYVRAFLQLTDAGSTFLYTNNAGIAAIPTSTTITVDNVANLNNGSTTYVAYLFATCPGVSKVGTYTGTGTTQTINCGFTAGSRFVLIKRTDSTGDWYVWDSARGIVAGDDPYLLLNSTAAEVTNTDYIDTTSVGFEITSTAPAAINANGGTFVFLAIA
jgi:hypothetical protein